MRCTWEERRGINYVIDNHGKRRKFKEMYDPKEYHEKYEDYKKFLFVRNPFDRIISAFRNKFEFGGGPHEDPIFLEKYGRHIIQKYRENASETSLRTGADVTFVEFLKFLTQGEYFLKKILL